MKRTKVAFVGRGTEPGPVCLWSLVRPSGMDERNLGARLPEASAPCLICPLHEVRFLYLFFKGALKLPLHFDSHLTINYMLKSLNKEELCKL